MSSPFRRSERSSPYSSPARQTQPDSRRPQQRTPNGFRQSPRPERRGSTSSPARQFADEFSKLWLDDERAFRRQLDTQADEQEKLHREALTKARAEHEAVRQSAERAREQLELEIEKEKRRRQEAEKASVEKARRELAEAEALIKKRELEEARKREEDARARQEQQRELEETNRRIQAQKKQEEEEQARRQAESERLEKEAKEKKAQEEAAEKERAAKAAEQARAAQQQVPPQTNGTPTATPASAPTATATPFAPTQPQASAGVTGVRVDPGQAAPALTPTGIVTPATDREAEHQRYLEIHKRLKEMRKHVVSEAAKIPGLKNQLSDMRRTINKSLGLLNKVDKTQNRKPTTDIRTLLDQAAQMSQIPIDPAQYMMLPSSSGPYPGPLLFLLSHLAKGIINRCVNEVSRDSAQADPVGILTVTLFSSPNYYYNGQPMIDVLWAKFHKVCPLLFGIWGPHNTAAGKARLGWRFEKDIDDNGNVTGGYWVNLQEHHDRMVGLAAVFAAITLRDFSKARNANPAPNKLFWTALARILSAPPAEHTSSHFVVLKNMLDNYAERFIKLFGSAALAAIRQACIVFPQGTGASEAGRVDSSVLGVTTLPEMLQVKIGLQLAS